MKPFVFTLTILSFLCLAVNSSAWIDAPGYFTYPIGDFTGISSTFGPRTVTSTWFHSGIDIARITYNNPPGGGTPTDAFTEITMWVRCKVKHVGGNSISFWNLASNGPEYFAYCHMVLSGNIFENDILEVGTVIGTLAYAEGGYHLHLDTWEWGVFNSDGDFNTQRSSSQSNYDRTQSFTTNPLKWMGFRYETTDDKNRCTYSYSPTLGQTWPSETIDNATRRYIKLEITSKQNDYTLNSIKVSKGLAKKSGSPYLTQDFLYNKAGAINNDGPATVTFARLKESDGLVKAITSNNDNGTNIKRDVGTVAEFEQVKAGIKILPTDFTTGGNKKYTFKIFISDTYTPDLMSLCAVDIRGKVMLQLNDVPLSTCTGGTCPSNIQPPSQITAVPHSDGINVTWNTVPDARSYIIYRRNTATESILDAVPVAVAGLTQTSHVDLFAYNGLQPYGGYYYSIACIDNYRLEGPNSSEVVVYAQTLPVDIHFPSYKLYKGPDPLSWGFSAATNMTVPYAEEPDQRFFISTYLTIANTALTSASATIPIDVTRRSKTVMVKCQMRWSDVIGPYLKSGNSFCIELYNGTMLAYSLVFTPNGTADNLTTNDVYLKDGITYYAAGKTGTVVPPTWIDFVLVLNRTVGSGVLKLIEGFIDFHDNNGLRKIISLSQGSYSTFTSLQFKLNGSNIGNVRIDNIQLMTCD